MQAWAHWRGRYGVQHAPPVLVSQNGPHDITSVHYARLEHGQHTLRILSR